jgi:hypothetical protein
VQALRVDAVADSGQMYAGRAFRDCMTAARIRHVPVMLVRRGMHYVTDDGVTFDALGSEDPLLAEGSNDVNENSVVLRLTYRCAACVRPFRMLFTGDAGTQSEARMLAAGADLEADVQMSHFARLSLHFDTKRSTRIESGQEGSEARRPNRADFWGAVVGSRSFKQLDGFVDRRFSPRRPTRSISVHSVRPTIPRRRFAMLGQLSRSVPGDKIPLPADNAGAEMSRTPNRNCLARPSVRRLSEVACGGPKVPPPPLDETPGDGINPADSWLSEVRFELRIDIPNIKQRSEIPNLPI